MAQLLGPERHALIVELARLLRAHGSWCGETHLQKAAYFLQNLASVPLGYSFILYKHGPFGFELRDDIGGMLAEGYLALKPREYPYGPSIVLDRWGERLLTEHVEAVSRYRDALDYTARVLGGMNVTELERVSTALLVTRASPGESVEWRAGELHRLKPHVSAEDARQAVLKIDALIRGAEEGLHATQ